MQPRYWRPYCGLSWTLSRSLTVLLFSKMNSTSQLAAKIQAQYWAELKPDDFLKDVKKVFDSGCVTERFFADLLFFTEAIDGYASSARACAAVETEKLLKMRRDVAKPFFERYPQYVSYRNFITELETPRLYRQLQKVENYRRDLLSLVESLLGIRSA